MSALTRPAMRLAALLGAVLAAGCVTRGAPPSVMPGVPVRLAAGDTVALPDRSSLAYLGLANDSRCPRGVQCIHVGSVEVRFRHDDRTGPRTLRIDAPRALEARLGTRWRLVLTDVAAATPDAIDVRIDPVD